VRPVHRYFDFGLWYDAVFRICEELHLKIIQNVNVPTSPYISPGIVHNVFVSDYVRQAFDGNSQTEASVIYPGSDLQFFSSNGELQGNNHTIGMVYRLDRDKLNAESIEVFIEAMRKMPGLRAYIVGGGFYMKDFRKRVRVEGLSDRFTFTGFVPYQELPQHYKNISLIIAPVHDESFGQVTPFAMGMGLPVAGYDTGAMKEILGSGDTLVPYGDRNALSDMIVSLMNDPAKRKDLGNRNKERARKLFDVSGMIKEYDKLYSRNLARYHG
jgi:glycosyltransferase involved in cell wall biosynthesis